MKICVISFHPKVHAPTRLIEEGQKRGHEMTFVNWEDVVLDVNGGIYFGNKNQQFDQFDVVIPRSDSYRIEVDGRLVSRNLDTIFRCLIQYCKKNKIFFLNEKYFTSYQSLDKISQQYFFAENNLPGLRTWFMTDLDKLSDKSVIKFPVVAKIAQGSTGKSVYKFNDEKELEDFFRLREVDEKLYLLQEYHEIDCDYRVLAVDGQVLGVMKRSAQEGEWRTNFSLGGNVEAAETTPEIEDIAKNVAEKMGLNYVGIDLLEINGKMHIIETNSLPQFKGFEKAFPNVNVAEALIKLAESKVG